MLITLTTPDNWVLSKAPSQHTQPLFLLSDLCWNSFSFKKPSVKWLLSIWHLCRSVSDAAVEVLWSLFFSFYVSYLIWTSGFPCILVCWEVINHRMPTKNILFNWKPSAVNQDENHSFYFLMREIRNTHALITSWFHFTMVRRKKKKKKKLKISPKHKVTQLKKNLKKGNRKWIH